MISDTRVKFLKIYANLPLPVRDEVIVVLDDEPISWKILKLEVENKTKKGDQALKILKSLKIIV